MKLVFFLPGILKKPFRALLRRRKRLTENRTTEEGEEVAEDEDSPTEEVRVLQTAKKAAVQKLQGRLRKEIAPEEDGHTREEEEMAAEEGQMSSATGATSGGTEPLNVQKLNKLVRGER